MSDFGIRVVGGARLPGHYGNLLDNLAFNVLYSDWPRTGKEHLCETSA